MIKLEIAIEVSDLKEIARLEKIINANIDAFRFGA